MAFMGRAILILLLVAMAGCRPVPADLAGTEQRLSNGGTLRIGIVASLSERSYADAIAKSSAAALGMAYRSESGVAEDILPALDEGSIDLVIGRFAKRSPWAADVLLSRAIGEEPVSGEEPVWRFVTRNGENRWAMTIDRLTGDAVAGQ